MKLTPFFFNPKLFSISIPAKTSSTGFSVKDTLIVSSNSKLIKYAHPDVKKALSFVGVNLQETTEITFEQAKKHFHKKLMRFHPDKNAKNETMDKITREKTAKILDAWKLIEDWFKS